jgi:hypothetical protein
MSSAEAGRQVDLSSCHQPRQLSMIDDLQHAKALAEAQAVEFCGRQMTSVQKHLPHEKAYAKPYRWSRNYPGQC